MNKKGTYILEATIIFPVFVAALSIMISIIPLIAACENIVFSVADEIRLDAVEAAFIKEKISFPVLVTARVRQENKRLSNFRVTGYKRLYRANEIDDLIFATFKAGFDSRITLIPVGTASFEGALMARAYTGTTHEVTDDDGKIVYIFPERGTKYHAAGCRHLESHCRLTILTSEIKTKYRECPLCDPGSITGVNVFVFESAGEAYHKASCRSVEKEKYYIETTRGSAKESGYSACSVCGG